MVTFFSLRNTVPVFVRLWAAFPHKQLKDASSDLSNSHSHSSTLDFFSLIHLTAAFMAEPGATASVMRFMCVFVGPGQSHVCFCGTRGKGQRAGGCRHTAMDQNAWHPGENWSFFDSAIQFLQ